jgi:hypothetical protein
LCLLLDSFLFRLARVETPLLLVVLRVELTLHQLLLQALVCRLLRLVIAKVIGLIAKVTLHLRTYVLVVYNFLEDLSMISGSLSLLILFLNKVRLRLHN